MVLRRLASSGWGRWIAALCVALITLVMLEGAADAADPCHAGMGSLSYNVAVGATDGGAGGDVPDGAPTTALHQHHCCGAHATATPVDAASVETAQLPGRAAVLVRDGFVPSFDPSGLERPPKFSASV